MPADGGIRFGQYVLLRRIARGGMAEVFLAQQRGLEGFDRRVAVKRILPHLADSPDFVKMFLGEAKLAAQLTHPNIVHIYDFGKVENDYFIAMEYVEGVHAGQLFKHGERERLSPTFVARIGADAASALHYAHELRALNGKAYGLVHRDVSPANLMVSYDGVVKLCDFGIAKAAAMSDQLTNPGQVKGKYAYMSPEQTVASPLDGRSDVFSLAVVMWELLAGKTIVPRGDPVEAMRAIRDGKLPSIEAAAPGIPRALADAIHWALQTKRESRATAMDLAQVLEAFIKASPELATPMQIGNWVRSRFPREVTGSHQAISASARPTGDGTAPHGTVAAPTTGEQEVGTSLSNPGTLGEPGTSLTQGVTMMPLGSGDLLSVGGTQDDDRDTGHDDHGDGETVMEPPRSLRTGPVTGRITKPRAGARLETGSDPSSDTASETVDDSDDRETFDGETIQKRRPDSETTELSPNQLIANRASTPNLRPSAAPRRPSAAGIAGIPESPTQRESSARTSDSAPRAAPGAPTLIAAAVRPSQPTLAVHAPEMFGVPATGELHPMFGAGRGEGTVYVRKDQPRRTKVLVILGAIALLSFLIALGAATSSPQLPASTPRDAALAINLVDAAPDAALAARDPGAVVTAGRSLVTVNTQPPGGTVKIGTEGARRAPAQFALAPGGYDAVAELDGYYPERRRLEVTSNVDSAFEIAFTRRVPAPTTNALPTAAEQYGRLTVRTTPYSEVFLGTRKLGETPFAELELPVGKHTLTFTHPDHMTVRRTVVIEPGKTTKLAPFDLP